MCKRCERLRRMNEGAGQNARHPTAVGMTALRSDVLRSDVGMGTFCPQHPDPEGIPNIILARVKITG